MDILTVLKDGVSNIVRKSEPLAPRSILPRPKGRGLPSIWIKLLKQFNHDNASPWSELDKIGCPITTRVQHREAESKYRLADSQSGILERLMLNHTKYAKGSLDTLRRRHPELWEQTSKELLEAISTGQPRAIDSYLKRICAYSPTRKDCLQNNGNGSKTHKAALTHIIKAQMAFQAVEKYCLATAASQTSGTVRFSFVNGIIIQKLLFEHGLIRKPASLFWFKLMWHFVTQKPILMPLLQPKGIYCFYSQKLINSLAQHINGRSCLEIAAGDGTLAKFLRATKTPVIATDDFSWRRAIHYPDSVEQLDARKALQKYHPPVVLCSWPPPGNNFERHVFLSPHVDLYIVIGSKHRFATGDWAAYVRQQDFDWGIDETLSKCVLPPELDNAVLVFRRKQS